MRAPAATKFRFTTKDYHRMGDAGIIPPDARVELLDGQIIPMSPIGPSHSGMTNFLNKFFITSSRERWITSVQNPVVLDEFSEPEPDLMLLKPTPDFYASNHPVPKDVFLLVEVSVTSLPFDREQKIPAYAKAGILEVWVVNVEEKVVEVHRKPNFAGYSATTTFGIGQELSPFAFPDAILEVSSLFISK